MRSALTTVAAFVLTLLLSLDAHAQNPSNVASAGGWGALGLTEARFGESLVWNPALSALPDVREQSFTPPAIELEMLGDSWKAWKSGSSALSVLRGDAKAATDWVAHASEGLYGGASGSVLWFGAHSKGFALALTTQGRSLLDLPARATAALAGAETADTAETGFARYSLTTTAQIGRAFSVGVLPLLGYSWFGVSGKYTMVHRHSAGTASFGTASEVAAMLPSSADVDITDPYAAGFDIPVMDVTSGRVIGADVGLVANPGGAALLSVTATNVYQSATVGDDALKRRHIYSLGAANQPGGPGVESEDVDARNLTGTELERFEEHVMAMRFPRVVRGAFSFDLRDVRLGVAGAVPYEDGDAIGLAATEKWGAAIALLRSSITPRLAFQEARDGTYRLSLGATHHSCGGRTTWSLTASRGDGTGFGLAFSHVFGKRIGC